MCQRTEDGSSTFGGERGKVDTTQLQSREREVEAAVAGEAVSKAPTRPTSGEEEELKTNLQNKGLISADRGTRATLMRTIPRSLFKSYTKDLLFPIFKLTLRNVMILARRLCLLFSHQGKQRNAAFQHGF